MCLHFQWLIINIDREHLKQQGKCQFLFNFTNLIFLVFNLIETYN